MKLLDPAGTRYRSAYIGQTPVPADARSVTIPLPGDGDPRLAMGIAISSWNSAVYGFTVTANAFTVEFSGVSPGGTLNWVLFLGH